jgi:hypothetical protein
MTKALLKILVEFLGYLAIPAPIFAYWIGGGLMHKWGTIWEFFHAYGITDAHWYVYSFIAIGISLFGIYRLYGWWQTTTHKMGRPLILVGIGIWVLILSVSASIGVAEWGIGNMPTETRPPSSTSTQTAEPPDTPTSTPTPTFTPVPTLSADQQSKEEITNAIYTLIKSLTAPDLPPDWDNVITQEYLTDRLLAQYGGLNNLSRHFSDRAISIEIDRIDLQEPDHLKADAWVTLSEVVGESKPSCTFMFLVVWKPGANNGNGAWLIDSDYYWVFTEGQVIATPNCY